MSNRLSKIREAGRRSSGVTARVHHPGIGFQRFTLARAAWFAGAVGLLILSNYVPRWLGFIILPAAFALTVCACLMPWIPLTEWEKATKEEFGNIDNADGHDQMATAKQQEF